MGILAVPYVSIPTDGILGILVCIVILKSGFNSFKENMVLLLGEGADPAVKEEIMKIVTVYIPAWSVEDISLHDYGPGNKLVFIKITAVPENRYKPYIPGFGQYQKRDQTKAADGCHFISDAHRSCKMK